MSDRVARLRGAQDLVDEALRAHREGRHRDAVDLEARAERLIGRVQGQIIREVASLPGHTLCPYCAAEPGHLHAEGLCPLRHVGAVAVVRAGLHRLLERVVQAEADATAAEDALARSRAVMTGLHRQVIDLERRLKRYRHPVTGAWPEPDSTTIERAVTGHIEGGGRG